MKERPILMTAAMVLASMREVGPKWQTRRKIKDAPAPGASHQSFMTDDGFEGHWFEGDGTPEGAELLGERLFCPYGQAGDMLWVRETCFDVRPWRHAPLFAAVKPDYLYRADYDYREGQRERSVIGCHRWTPSIHMPRVASRLSLEILKVRAQHLQDITDADALAEGVFELPDLRGLFTYPGCDRNFVSERGAFSHLWESINGPGSWDANDWVWVIDFKKVPPP